MNCPIPKDFPSGDVYIIGNQSADLDSCISALSLSELIPRVNPDINCIPLVRGERSDLRLKPEITSLLRRASVNTDRLVFTSELSDPDLTGKRVILVDHNLPEDETSACRVSGIVDHHKDSGLFRDLSLRDIRVCGSCCSIISAYWQHCSLELPSSQRLLLAGTIEVDTGGLSPEWGKTTDLDREQYIRLTEGLRSEDRAFLKTLLALKNDLGHLNMAEHLQRDYKTFPLPAYRGGISSVTLPIEEFFGSGFFSPADVEEFCRNRCPGFLLIMHSIGSPLRRELSLYCPSCQEDRIRREEKLTKALEALETTPMGKTVRDDQTWHHYRLNDPKVSRKVLVPLLLHLLT